MRILLTGATGFIGNFLLRRLLARGHRVVAIVRPDSVGRLRGVAGDDSLLTIVPGDLYEGVSCEDTVDAIVHAAAQSPYNCRSAADYVRNNIVACRQLAEWALRNKVSRVIYLSSISAYGQVRDSVVDENTAIIDPDDYGLSKLVGERVFAACADRISSAAIRLPGVLGPGAHSPWLAHMAARARRNAPIHAYNPTALFNNAVHIHDLCQAVDALLESEMEGFETFTLACAEPIPVREVLSRVLALTHSASPVSFVEDDRVSFTISCAKAAERIGYRPMTMQTVLEKYIQHEMKGCLRAVHGR